MFLAGVTPYLFIFLAGVLVASVLLPSVIRFAVHLGILDIPDSRRIHTSPIPRAGGVAVFIATHVVCLSLFLLPSFPGSGELVNFSWWLKFIIGSSIITLVGLIDDLQGLRPLVKLSGQTTAALVMYLANIRVRMVFGLELPVGLDFIVTIGWFLFVTNAFNLIDGIDGLAAGLAAIAALGIAGSLVFRELYFEALLFTAFMGACVGFLRYNHHPARVFLGDSGSNFIGFFLAALMLATSSKGSTVAYMWVPIFALIVPLLDTLLAIWRRSARVTVSYLRDEEKQAGIMSADLEHVHHRLMELGLSQRDVTAFLYLVNAVVVFVGLMSLPYQDHAWGVLLITGIVGLYLLCRYFPLGELWDSALIILHALGSPRKPAVAFASYFVIDLLCLATALLLAVHLTHPDFSHTTVVHSGVETFAIWCGLPLFSIIALETYPHFWRKDSGRVILLGFLFVVGLWSFGYACTKLLVQLSPQAFFVRASLFSGFAFSFLIASRVLLSLVERFIHLKIKNGQTPWENAAEEVHPKVLNKTDSAKSLPLGFYSRIWNTRDDTFFAENANESLAETTMQDSSLVPDPKDELYFTKDLSPLN